MIYQKGICKVTNQQVKLGAKYSLGTKLDVKNHQQYKVLVFNKVVDFPCEMECGSVTSNCPIYKKFTKEIPYS